MPRTTSCRSRFFLAYGRCSPQRFLQPKARVGRYSSEESIATIGFFAATIYIDIQRLKSEKIFSFAHFYVLATVSWNALSPGKQTRNRRTFAISTSIGNVVGLLAAWQIVK